MMYVKLISRNLKRSTKEYGIYMMTLILAVTLMYAFNGVALSSEVRELSMNMDAFAAVAVIASILIVFVLAWLVYYISKFIVEKRSREFGMYMLMGMTRKQVSRMFLLEQVSMGLLAYVIGCIIGIFAYEVIQAIIVHMFVQKDITFSIHFSFAGAGLTLLYFVMMYVLELFREQRYLKRKSIYDLLHSDRKNDVHVSDKKRFIVYLFFGILFYFVALKELDLAFSGEINSGLGLIIPVCLIVTSIICIFLGLSHVLTSYINRKKQIKYKGNTMFLTSQIGSRLHTSRAVLALLSILTLSSFMLVSMGLKFHQAQGDSAALFPFEIQANQQDEGIPLDVSMIKDFLNERHITYQDHMFKEYFGLDYDVMAIVNDIAWEKLYQKPQDFAYIRYSDYKALRKLLHEKPMKMKENEYLIVTSSDFANRVSENAKDIQIDGTKFKQCDTRGYGESRYHAVVIVLPDVILDTQQTSSLKSYVVNTSIPSTIEWNEEMEGAFLRSNSAPQKENEAWRMTNSIMLKAEWTASNLTSTLTFVFTLIYIAIILSCVSATVLAIQQMSDTWKQKKSYHMLWKMGVDKKVIYSILRKQIAVYFFVPFVIPVLFVFPIVKVCDQLFQMSYSRSSMIPLCFFAIVFYLVIYIVYYALAYVNCKHSIQDGLEQ